MFEITCSEPGLTIIPQYAPSWHKKSTKTIMKGTALYLIDSTSKNFCVASLEIFICPVILNI